MCNYHPRNMNTHYIYVLCHHTVCVQGGLSVARCSLAVCLASAACERTEGFAYAAMYISVAFNTHITGSELCIGAGTVKVLVLCSREGN